MQPVEITAAYLEAPVRRRNRRRAKDLAHEKLCEIQQDFRATRNTLEVAQEHLLPRSEAVDSILIRHEAELAMIRSEVKSLLGRLGIKAASCGPFLVRRAA